MGTKLDAAKICMNSGCYMAIANGKYTNPLNRLVEKNICTWFLPKISSLDARKKWIVSSIGSNGKIHIDNGASNALRNGKSLLPAGIIKVEGSFLKGDNILIVDQNGEDCARGITSFSSTPSTRLPFVIILPFKYLLSSLIVSEISKPPIFFSFSFIGLTTK